MKDKTSNKVKKNKNKYLITILLSFLITALSVSSCEKTKQIKLTKNEEEISITIEEARKELEEQPEDNFEIKRIRDTQKKQEVLTGNPVTQEQIKPTKNESSNLKGESSLSSTVNKTKDTSDKLESEKEFTTAREPKQDAKTETTDDKKLEKESGSEKILELEPGPWTDKESEPEPQSKPEPKPVSEQESETTPSAPFTPYYMPAVGSHGLYDSYTEAVKVAESIESQYWNKVDNLEDPGWEWSGWEVYPVWYYFAPGEYIEYYTINYY